ncbi:MAG: cyclodeaminase/cyclohydrolase family protein [Firmicutes bacterium]|nr:cyclodeaminase/cyclohydrolase family protein [Bacillota bacterium]MBR4020490.1 cyclodeaminase/cyclohydrolase family protein [Bacillota bacterium]
MKLIDMQVKDYLELLKSDAPAPGGGSVSALAGAQGVGLFMMVADLTLGKEKYADYQEICAQAKEKGMALYEELVESIDKDTDAFNLIAAAFKMPKETDEEKAARRKAIADGTLVATQVPFRTMQLGYEGLMIAKEMIGKSNPNAASDLGVAILNLTACIKGAWLNVLINLPGVKDEEKAAYYNAEGKKMYDEADAIASGLYEDVAASL